MMPARRAFLLVAVISIGIALLIFFPPEAIVQPRAQPTSAPMNASAPRSAPSVAEGTGEAPSELAAELNAPNGDIRRDLEIASQLFVAWQSNFPREGNPVGENFEITAALTGANPLHFAFVPRSHRAINARGELCDRWGTPFRFHQISGTHMEIRSAGPDRKFATAYDALWPRE